MFAFPSRMARTLGSETIRSRALSTARLAWELMSTRWPRRTSCQMASAITVVLPVPGGP